MRAFIVSVDYSHELRLTMGYNRHHFTEVNVITSPRDTPNVCPIAEANDARVYATDAFYRNGAHFNKWLALEEGLDRFGEHGWICLMDADVLWPRNPEFTIEPKIGYLYTPRRRMCETVPAEVPPESEWRRYPIHRQEKEFAGYSQVFNGKDEVLGPPPWHEIDWRTAGGADSFFQAKWPAEKKIRPPFEVLHLGPAGMNWCGRASPLADGTIPDGAAERVATLRNLIRSRTHGPDRFRAEKLPP